MLKYSKITVGGWYFKGHLSRYAMIGILVWQELHNSQISPCLCRHCAAHLAWQFQSVVHYTRGQILEQPFEILCYLPIFQSDTGSEILYDRQRTSEKQF